MLPWIWETRDAQTRSHQLPVICLCGLPQERDKQRVIEQRKGAKVLAHQLEERELERLRLEDLRHQVRSSSVCWRMRKHALQGG